MKIYIISGAGISAPSGISTFRDEEKGLWNNHDINEICNIDTWRKNYDKVHRFYNDMRINMKDKKPNAAHLQIAKWQEQYGEENVINITQNIDDLFEKANVKNTIHLHGELTKMNCHVCDSIYDINYSSFTNESTCPICNGKYSKPNVVFFGEQAPKYALLNKAFRDITSDDIIIVVGTLGKIVPIDLYIKGIYGKKPLKILNNLEISKYINEIHYDHVFYESCIEAFPKIDILVKLK